MSDFYLKVIYLENCPYSLNSIQLIRSNKIRYKCIEIPTQFKEMFKTSEIKTYPQIYLKKIGKKGNLLLGGYSDIEYIIKLLKNTKLTTDLMDKLSKKYNFISINKLSILHKLIN